MKWIQPAGWSIQHNYDIYHIIQENLYSERKDSKTALKNKGTIIYIYCLYEYK